MHASIEYDEVAVVFNCSMMYNVYTYLLCMYVRMYACTYVCGQVWEKKRRWISIRIITIITVISARIIKWSIVNNVEQNEPKKKKTWIDEVTKKFEKNTWQCWRRVRRSIKRDTIFQRQNRNVKSCTRVQSYHDETDPLDRTNDSKQ